MSGHRICAALSLLGLVGCGGGPTADLQEYAREVKARPPGPIDPLPEIQQIDTYVFEPASDRDPFVLDAASSQVATKPTGGGVAPDPLRRKEELERYPLDALHMVGTLELGDTRWALISTPDASLLRVRVGNHMGRNNGQIIRITEEGIELAEIVSDGSGEWRERQAAIALSQ